jgi:hypothetical protein
MRAARKQVEEIQRLKKAIEKTKSAHLKNDYSKNIKRLTSELREYCKYRNYDFYKVINGDF